MSAFRQFFALALVAIVALAPVTADARAGASSSRSGSSYSSMGSMGSHTYDASPGAAPIQRSMTPNSSSSPSTGSTWISPGYGGYGSGYARHPFWSGLAGGLFGGWLGSMMFGSSAYADGGYSMHTGGFFGTLLMFFLIFWIGRMLFRGFVGGGFGAMRPAFLQGGGLGAPMGGYQPMSRAAQTQISLTDQDLGAFGQVLTGVQNAWSQGNLDTLKRYVTPEMLSYFAEMLANNASQGVANRVENVALIEGEPRESWREGAVDYATTYLRWRAVDYTHRLDRKPGDVDFLVEGDPRQPTESQEVWTFRRTGSGRWLLSAIQQVR